MASDVIGFPHNAAAATLYALIRNADGQIWETVGPSFEAYSTANIANYDIALTEQGTASQFYTFTFPSAITAGVFSIAVYSQAGGAPAEGDISVAEGEIEWTGSVIVAQTGDAFAEIGSAGVGLTDLQLPADGLDLVLVDGKTLPAALQIMASVVAGEISGAGTGTEVFIGLDGVTTRVTVTVDSSGNRTTVVYA